MAASKNPLPVQGRLDFVVHDPASAASLFQATPAPLPTVRPRPAADRPVSPGRSGGEGPAPGTPVAVTQVPGTQAAGTAARGSQARGSQARGSQALMGQAPMGQAPRTEHARGPAHAERRSRPLLELATFRLPIRVVAEAPNQAMGTLHTEHLPARRELLMEVCGTLLVAASFLLAAAYL